MQYLARVLIILLAICACKPRQHSELASLASEIGNERLLVSRADPYEPDDGFATRDHKFGVGNGTPVSWPIHNNILGRKPLLIYYAVDTEEPLMQISTSYELYQLHQACQQSYSVNWVAILNSAYANGSESFTYCKDTHIQSLRPAAAHFRYRDAILRHMDDMSANPDVSQISRYLVTMPMTVTAENRAFFKMYREFPLTHPQLLLEILKSIVSKFAVSEYGYYLHLKSHGSANLALTGINAEDIAKRTKTQEELIAKELKKSGKFNEQNLAVLMRTKSKDFFSKPVDKSWLNLVESIGLGQKCKEHCFNGADLTYKRVAVKTRSKESNVPLTIFRQSSEMLRHLGVIYGEESRKAEPVALAIDEVKSLNPKAGAIIKSQGQSSFVSQYDFLKILKDTEHQEKIKIGTKDTLSQEGGLQNGEGDRGLANEGGLENSGGLNEVAGLSEYQGLSMEYAGLTAGASPSIVGGGLSTMGTGLSAESYFGASFAAVGRALSEFYYKEPASGIRFPAFALTFIESCRGLDFIKFSMENVGTPDTPVWRIKYPSEALSYFAWFIGKKSDFRVFDEQAKSFLTPFYRATSFLYYGSGTIWYRNLDWNDIWQYAHQESNKSGNGSVGVNFFRGMLHRLAMGVNNYSKPNED